MHSFYATTAKAMEELLAEELKSLGALNVAPGRAGVSFEGSLETAYRVCLHSRIANRVLVPLKTFAAPSPEKLYAGVKSVRWSDHLGPEQTIAVDFASNQSQITHTHFGALKVKDAIVDQMRSIHGVRPSVRIDRPDIRVNVYLSKDQATVAIDLSGESLHLRGYREEGARAPLKENLAAAILMSAGWTGDQDRFPALMDPMCGSGTLLIEAALIAAKVAPGLDRSHFGFLGWKNHEPKIWKRLLDEAQDQIIEDPKRLPKIVGYDRDFRAVRVALANVERADLVGRIHVEKRDFSACEPVAEKGLILMNPPYGERIGEMEELKILHKEMGDTFKKKFKGWEAGVFTGSPELAKCIGLKPSRRIVLYNGAIECRLLKFELY